MCLIPDLYLQYFSTPAKAPSSGYSTLQREARSESSWGSAPVRAEVRQEVYREEKHGRASKKHSLIRICSINDLISKKPEKIITILSQHVLCGPVVVVCVEKIYN